VILAAVYASNKPRCKASSAFYCYARLSDSGKGHFIYGHLFIYEGIGYNMYTVNLGSL